MRGQPELTASTYRALTSAFLWMLGATFLVALLCRFAAPDVVVETDGFLLGLFSRITASSWYQLFIGAGLGMIGYGLCLRFALGDSPSAGLFSRLVGVLDLADTEVQADQRGLTEVTNYALAPLRDAAAIFPGLGFLGTVIGVSIAIGSLDAVVETGDTADLMTGLRSAFDTTFFGLTFSVVLSLIASVIEARVAQKSLSRPSTTSNEA